jgi:hypothetical protein
MGGVVSCRQTPLFAFRFEEGQILRKRRDSDDELAPLRGVWDY